MHMGLEPYLVASSVEVFVAQRLVRLICPKCKEEDKNILPELRADIARSLGPNAPAAIKVYHGKGCDHCNRTGYYGRSAIYEILIVTEEIRQATLEKRSAAVIKKLAMKNGMVTLRQEGWRKVLDGVTTAAEVMNHTIKDEEFSESSLAPAATTLSAAIPTGGQVSSRVVKPELLSAKNEYDSRVYQRAKEKVSIRYAIVRQDAQDPTKLVIDKIEHASISKDISAGGLRFVSGYTLPIGTILELKVQLDKNERSIDCLAKICRVEDDNLSAMFSLVAYYLDITSADRVKIDAFVRAHQGNEV